MATASGHVTARYSHPGDLARPGQGSQPAAGTRAWRVQHRHPQLLAEEAGARQRLQESSRGCGEPGRWIVPAAAPSAAAGDGWGNLDRPSRGDGRVAGRAPHILAAVIFSLPFQVPFIVSNSWPVAVNFSTVPERQRTVTSVPALLKVPTPPSVASMGVKMSRGCVSLHFT